MCHPWKNSLIVLMAYLCHIFFSPDFRPLYKEMIVHTLYIHTLLLYVCLYD
jgi:hypothetical protein